ncbi:RNase adapter RapZ [Streptomyces sp. SID3343]|uniref:RapZ C-terminal domain-containing protein n=1 Tax=Streptomyces sp. SID3343 TaxID=2690260 RepID=UPI00136EECA4|nr:RNase adapter RapZ [Streptomyces sp. SID3343]MYW04573.1 hypothetical protein [Streptomyces sp. SID3343]
MTNAPLVRIVSFGYGHDDPPTATITYDLRVLFRNPHRDPAMRYLTGLDDAVYTHVLATPGIERVATNAADTARGLLADTGGPIVIATGCVGGRHRSVGMARRIAEHLHAAGTDVDIDHRDVHRDVLPTVTHRAH